MDVRNDRGSVYPPAMPGTRAARPRRRVLEATAVASVLAGTPSLAAALSREGVVGTWHYGVRATRAIGVLVPPGRPNLVGGVLAHFGISAAVGEVFGRFLPVRHSIAWGAAGGVVMGLVNVGLIGRRFPPSAICRSAGKSPTTWRSA